MHRSIEQPRKEKNLLHTHHTYQETAKGEILLDFFSGLCKARRWRRSTLDGSNAKTVAATAATAVVVAAAAVVRYYWYFRVVVDV